MITKDIAYQVGGKTLTGYFTVDETRPGKRPGVLVCHQGGGLTEHAKARARMLAAEGYAAFALDMYGEVATGIEHAMGLLGALAKDKPLLRERALAGLAQLKAQANVDPARLATVGYCFGGAVVIELARSSTELACVASMHPGMSYVLGDDRKVHAKALVCAGATDPHVAPQMREQFITEMEKAGADYQLIVYGGAGHSFTDKSVDAMNIPHFKYHEPTDRRSWAAMRQLFDEALGAP
jgi:dienelactone hydrolase